jgi:hypothetical protein
MLDSYIITPIQEKFDLHRSAVRHDRQVGKGQGQVRAKIS